MPLASPKNIDPAFQSNRLLFSPLSSDDLPLTIDLWTNPEVTRFVGGTVEKQTLEAQHQTYTRRCAGGAIGVWTLTTRDAHEQIGTAILLPMPIEKDDTDWDLVTGDKLPSGDIEVGYVFKISAWGQGYATETCARMIDFGFQNTKLERIVASTDHENHSSQNVLKKSGMEQLEDQLSYGGVCPFFQITRTQWNERQQ